MRSVVYISYNGVLEPLGQSQVLAYLKPLVLDGFAIALVSFEKPTDLADHKRLQQMELELVRGQVPWKRLRYRATLAGKLWNVIEGAYAAWRLARRRKAVLFHARSHVAGAMALLARALHGGRLLFDLRGQLAEEYADSGHWQRGGGLYRATRRLESVLLDRCNGLVVLTESLAARLPKRPERETVVIPCCVDTAAFRPRTEDPPEALRPLAGRPLLVYAGSVGTWYLLDEMMAFFSVACRLRTDWHLLVLSRSGHHIIRQAAARAGLADGGITVLGETYDRMPAYLRACRAGLAFIKSVPSKQGSSPTKIAEYLASGLPVIVNAGVGDLDRFVEQEGVGIVLRSFEPPELERGARFLAGALRDRNSLRVRCMAVAARLFDLQAVGVARYGALYRSLGVE